NKNSDDDPRGLRPYVSLVTRIDPAFVVFENVPAIMKRTAAWKFLIHSLKRLKYHVAVGVINALDFAIPQQRQRTIVLASRIAIDLPTGSSKARTVREAIGHLPENDESILNHRAMKLSTKNLRRIRKLEPGGNSRKSGISFSDSYARMAWNGPA